MVHGGRGIAALALGLGLAAGGMAMDAAAQVAPSAERAERLEELVLGTKENDYAVSHKDYSLTAGKYYRLKVTSAGFKEYMFRAPDLFRNAWIRQVVVNDLEIHTNWIHGLEFDAQGTMEVFFIPQRSGDYDWFIEDFEQNGMQGKFVVKYEK
jgi:hypothetical protein